MVKKKISVANGLIGNEQAIFVRALHQKGYSYGLVVRLAINSLPSSGNVQFKQDGAMSNRIADAVISESDKIKLDEYVTRNKVSISQAIRDGLHILSQNGLLKED